LGIIKRYLSCLIEYLESQGKKQVAAFDEMFRQLGKMPDFKVPEKRRRRRRRRRRNKNWSEILMIFSSPSTSRTEFHL